MITKMGEIVTFGKYKGKTIDHVCQFDYSYLEWMSYRGLCSKDLIDLAMRGEYTKVKLKDGYGIVHDYSDEIKHVVVDGSLRLKDKDGNLSKIRSDMDLQERYVDDLKRMIDGEHWFEILSEHEQDDILYLKNKFETAHPSEYMSSVDFLCEIYTNI